MRTCPTKPDETIRYGDESPNQVLDLYRPAAPGPVPVVVAVHGGAFAMGDRTRELDALPELLQAGWAMASVEYRLSGEARFPAAVRDVKLAVAVLRARAGDLGLDPGFFAAWGRSAGGYLAAMLGVTPAAEFHPDGGDPSVQAVVDWYGPSDFTVMDRQFAAGPPVGVQEAPQCHDDPDSPESRFLGAPVQEVLEFAARANPITYVTASAPPFFLAAGTADAVVPHQQTTLLADALRAAGVPVELHLLDGARHADDRFEEELTPPTLEWLARLRQ